MNIFYNVLKEIDLKFGLVSEMMKIFVIKITITNGTASRNFFTFVFDETSVRKRLPWPAHKTFANFPMSLSCIHIRMFDGLMTIP